MLSVPWAALGQCRHASVALVCLQFLCWVAAAANASKHVRVRFPVHVCALQADRLLRCRRGACRRSSVHS